VHNTSSWSTQALRAQKPLGASQALWAQKPFGDVKPSGLKSPSGLKKGDESIGVLSGRNSYPSIVFVLQTPACPSGFFPGEVQSVGANKHSQHAAGSPALRLSISSPHNTSRRLLVRVRGSGEPWARDGRVGGW